MLVFHFIEEEMKRFKAAIASEGSYGAVQFNYSEQDQMYHYATSSQGHGQALTMPHYYPYVAQPVEQGKICFSA